LQILHLHPGNTVARRPKFLVVFSVPDANPDAGIIIAIYEYSCQGCEDFFEALVRGEEKPTCPSCGSEDLERHFPLPTVQSSGTREMAMRAARKRDQRQGQERARTQREYELAHHD